MMTKGKASLALSSRVKIDESNFAMIAEAVVTERSSDGRGRTLLFKRLSMSKLRGIYGLITNVAARVNTQDELTENVSDLQYIKVKMAYESGREDAVRDFVKKSGLMILLDEIKTYDQFVLYCRYAESLVAYFKFYGGKE